MSTVRLLEAVPNFSEGRDRTVVTAIVDAVAAAGVDVLDWSSDADHHRSVVTMVGTPAAVEDAAVAAARIAAERIDLRRHSGVHPRIGALDVFPVIPLIGLTLDDARESAHRIGARIAGEAGVPVFYYGAASDPPGRRLASLRAGGFEALRSGWPSDRLPDELPRGWRHAGAHPTAGVSCVGARPLLLAWNIFVGGIDLEMARRIAGGIRERDGGRAGVRALAFHLPGSERIQISINMEDIETTSPIDVFRDVESEVLRLGGTIEETEIIGMLPDPLLWSAAADRLKLTPGAARRMLSKRMVDVLTCHKPSSQDS